MAKKCVLCPIQSTSIKIFVEEEGVEANMIPVVMPHKDTNITTWIKKMLKFTTECAEHMISLILRKTCMEGCQYRLFVC